MEISLFLAKVLGLYLTIVSLFMLLRFREFLNLMREVIVQRGFMLTTATEVIIIGILIVVAHNVWTLSWPIVITILGWLILIKGILRLFFPRTAEKAGNWWMKHDNYLYGMAIIWLILGLFLLYNGFAPHFF